MTSHPDAALIALQREIDYADMMWESLYRERTAAEDAYLATKPLRPRATKPAMNDNSGPPLSEEAEKGAAKRARAAAGLTAAEEAQDRADDVRIAIRDKILATRARTVDGWRFKAKYAMAHFPGDPDEEVMASIVKDLLAMAEEVV